MVTSTPIKILEALRELVLESGVEAVRVDLVAARAGVNKRMIYHHFKDKQGLLQALFASQWLYLRMYHQRPDDGMSAASLAVLRPLYENKFGVEGPAEEFSLAVGPGRVGAALRILLPVLLDPDTLETPYTIQSPDKVASQQTFALFAMEIMGLLAPQLVDGLFTSTPGTVEYINECKRLLTGRGSESDGNPPTATTAGPKPRYRITSKSRPLA